MDGDSFFHYLGSLDWDDISLNLVEASSDEKKLAIRLRLWNGGSDEHWEVTATGLRQNRIVLGSCPDPWQFSRDHVLLWPLKQLTASLYFNGRTEKSRVALLGALFESHYALAGLWLPFGKYFKQSGRLEDILSHGHGMLAEGPQQLIEAYAEQLRAHQIKASVLTNVTKYWDGQRWLDENGELIALILGESFVVAEAITFERAADS